MELIKAENFKETMDEKVVPYLDSIRQTGYMERVPGQKIFWQHFEPENKKAVLVLVHGFTEGVDKFQEAAWYFLQNGLSVWMIQQRGHGLSYRETDNPCKVHITDYNEMVLDLHHFVHEVVKKAEGEDLPYYLFAHSMGGGISAIYLGRYPDDFQKAVLSSPMLQLVSNGVAMAGAKLFGGFMKLIGKDEDYLPGNSDYDGTYDLDKSCTNCLERYDYGYHMIQNRREYQMSGPSIRTSLQFLKITQEALRDENTSRVKAQVLLFQAGKDETVMPGGQNKYIEKIGEHGKLIRVEDAKHEIYRCKDEDMEQYWPVVLDFLS